ncbi:hypothetical protein Q5P01_020006 [Channa striata]|uniref:Uncharacterized protein n=1 Tax=Channa striata TaxID=64152 RepID=A0AA88LWN7_CHASR|nr:hypothetical protein Q5P01_020006 [Channa striata]
MPVLTAHGKMHAVRAQPESRRPVLEGLLGKHVGRRRTRGPRSFVGWDGPSCNLNITVMSNRRIQLCHPEKTRDPPRASADEHLREGTGVDEGRLCELSTRVPAELIPISLCDETTSGSIGPHRAIASLALSPTYNEPTAHETASSEVVCDQGTCGLDIRDLLEFLEPGEGEGCLDFGFAAFDWEEREASPYTLPNMEGLHDVFVDCFLRASTTILFWITDCITLTKEMVL